MKKLIWSPFNCLRYVLLTLALFALALIWHFSGLITNVTTRIISFDDTLRTSVPSQVLRNFSIASKLIEDETIIRKRKGLLLLTYHRSGSTFFGEYFNQRPDAFYIFEPLISFEDYCFVKSEEILKVQHLSDLFSCRFRDQSAIFKMLGKPEDSEEVKGDGQKCIPNNFCFRQKVKLFCSEKFCHHGNALCYGCEPVDLTAASEHCANSQLVVIKVIRLCQLKNLKPLFDDPTLDLKIVHLVRDPRGVYNSRGKVVQDDLDRRVNATCGAIHDSIQQVLNESENWLKGRYKLVRYEDLCLKPLQVARDIYNFVGLKMTKDIKSWILNNTNESVFNLGDVRSRRLASLIINSKNLNPLVKKTKMSQLRNRLLANPYTTTRNSSTTWLKWLGEIDNSQINFVQSACKNMMNDVGYNLLEPDDNRSRTKSVITKTCPQNILNHCTFS